MASVVVGLSVALATCVAALGLGVGAGAWGASEVLITQTRAPHLTQMHAGAVDPAAIDDFAKKHPEVTGHQISELVSLDATALWLTPEHTEAASSIEYSAMAQNTRMDLILDLEGRPARIASGQVGVPVALALGRGINVGDTVRIGEDTTLTVATLVRDGLMNTTLASSQRLLVNEADLPALRRSATGTEQLISFMLDDSAKADALLDAYTKAGMPANGPAVTTRLLRLMASLSDGLVAAVMLLVSGLLTMVAALALGLSVRIAVSADLSQIGTLRVIGLPGPALRRIYLARHLAIICGGAVLGGAVALLLLPSLTTSMRMRTGGAHTSAAEPFVIVAILLTLAGGWLVARRALRPALHGGVLDVMRGLSPKPRPRRRPAPSWLPAGMRVGLADMRGARGDHALLFSIALVATVLAVLPLSILTTASHQDFFRQTGVSTSDILISLRGQVDPARNAALDATLKDDPEVARYTMLEARRVEVLGTEGNWSGLAIEVGDHTAFPLTYTTGRPPTAPSEVALSQLQADDLQAKVSDEITIRANEGAATPERTLEVVGIYNDITNGGRGAKGALPTGVGTPLWTAIPLDISAGADTRTVAERYATVAAPARVADVESAAAEMLGPLLSSLRTVSLVAALGAAALLALLASLLLRLFLVRARAQRSIMQSIGVPLAGIRQQFGTRLAVPVAAGVLVGAALTAPLGTVVLKLAGSVLGTPSLTLHTDLLTLTGVPLVLLALTVALVPALVHRVPGPQAARIIAGGAE